MQRHRILVIEDEPEILSSMEEILLAAGFEVKAVPSGDQAVALLDQGNVFDLIVTDITMPGEYDGLRVGQHALGRSETKVVYITGRPEACAWDPVFRPREAYLLKPFPLRALVTTVDDLLRRQHL